jgi:hypothetical protein
MVRHVASRRRRWTELSGDSSVSALFSPRSDGCAQPRPHASCRSRGGLKSSTGHGEIARARAVADRAHRGRARDHLLLRGMGWVQRQLRRPVAVPVGQGRDRGRQAWHSAGVRRRGRHPVLAVGGRAVRVLAATRGVVLLAVTALFVVQLGRRIGWDNLSTDNIDAGPYLAGVGGLLALLAPTGLWPFRRRRSPPSDPETAPPP